METADLIIPRQFLHSVLAHSNIHSSELSRRVELHVVLAWQTGVNVLAWLASDPAKDEYNFVFPSAKCEWQEQKHFAKLISVVFVRYTKILGKKK